MAKQENPLYIMQLYYQISIFQTQTQVRVKWNSKLKAEVKTKLFLCIS